MYREGVEGLNSPDREDRPDYKVQLLGSSLWLTWPLLHAQWVGKGFQQASPNSHSSRQLPPRSIPHPSNLPIPCPDTQLASLPSIM